MSAAEIRVAMGEVQVGRAGQHLSALLGSCVAIALLWPEAGRCGLAHCLLPHSDQPGWNMGARYVNHALPTLLSLMGARRKDLGELEAVVAGGANMLGGAGICSGVGAQNVEEAERCLRSYGLLVAQRDVGGRRGRMVRIDCTTYSVSIGRVERYDGELHHASV